MVLVSRNSPSTNETSAGNTASFDVEFTRDLAEFDQLGLVVLRQNFQRVCMNLKHKSERCVVVEEDHVTSVEDFGYLLHAGLDCIFAVLN